jgi:hypothetical protein
VGRGWVTVRPPLGPGSKGLSVAVRGVMMKSVAITSVSRQVIATRSLLATSGAIVLSASAQRRVRATSAPATHRQTSCARWPLPSANAGSRARSVGQDQIRRSQAGSGRPRVRSHSYAHPGWVRGIAQAPRTVESRSIWRERDPGYGRKDLAYQKSDRERWDKRIGVTGSQAVAGSNPVSPTASGAAVGQLRGHHPLQLPARGGAVGPIGRRVGVRVR